MLHSASAIESKYTGDVHPRSIQLLEHRSDSDIFFFFFFDPIMLVGPLAYVERRVSTSIYEYLKV